MIGFESIQEQSNAVSASFDRFTLNPRPVSLEEAFETTDDDDFHIKRGGSKDEYGDRFYSYFGRINYSYASKYFVTFNIRRDGSTKFAPEQRYGVFPSISAAWNMHAEPFMSGVTSISSLKLRAGQGNIGNSSFKAYQYQQFYESSGLYSFGDGLPVSSLNLENKLANSLVKWESISTSSVAVDVGLFDNKIEATIEYYVRDTKDLIYGVRIPENQGLGKNVTSNIGKIRNSGLEISLNYRQSKNDISYNIGVNGAFNTTEVIKLDGQQPYFDEDDYRIELGGPVGRFYGLKSVGIYTEEQINANNPTVDGKLPQAGDLIFVDKTGDGKISTSANPLEDDRSFIGNPTPKFNYGITGGVNYKNFDLAFIFSGAAGVDVRNMLRFQRQAIDLDFTTTPAVYNNSGFNGNGVTDQPAHIHYNGTEVQNDPYGNYRNFSSYNLEKGGYLKLRNIQLGYKFPTALTSSMGVSSVRLYVMAQNLFTITNYSGIDPETSPSSDRKTFLQGGRVDELWRYPPTRIFSVGLDFNF